MTMKRTARLCQPDGSVEARFAFKAEEGELAQIVTKQRMLCGSTVG
jgi:hypothetical protein